MLAALIFTGCLSLFPVSETAGNRDVIPDGIQVSGKTVALLPPTLDGTLDAEDQISELQRLVGKTKWRSFSRNSVVAPVKIKLEYLRGGDDERVGHSIHVAFIVHADFASLSDHKVVTELMDAEDESDDAKPSGRKLTPDELKPIGITDLDNSTSYAVIDVPLLKKIRLAGVMRAQQKTNNDQLVIGFQLDPKFQNENANLRNVWSKIDEANGEDQKTTYDGLGGYLAITRLHEPENASLVEARILMHEPQTWFSGSNFLRSKLPLLLQEIARNFRRRVKEKTPN